MIILKGGIKEPLLLRQLAGMQKHFGFSIETKEDEVKQKTLQDVIEEERKKPGRPPKAKEETEISE